MKTATPTGAQFKAYEGLFGYFNRKLFAGELPACILNFSRANRAFGFFAPERWEHNASGAKGTHEISINPTTLKTRRPIEVASTLAHEMCHLWQHTKGKPSRSGYHNREWAGKMEMIGLQPTSDGTPTGARVGQHMTHLIVPGGRFELAFKELPPELLLPWSCSPEPTASKAPAARNKVKYSCDGCDANVWGKPGLSINCGDCEEPFRCEDEA